MKMISEKNDGKKIYQFPKYYDIAFAWNTEQELKLLFKIFKKQSDFLIKKILEPACGTGRMLIPLAKNGYIMQGYDSNPAMLKFAMEKINKHRLSDRVFLKQADMRNARFNIKFDAAVNLINSLGYLRSDQDILDHFNSTAESLNQKGLYIIQIACAHQKNTEFKKNEWTNQKNDLSINVCWQVRWEDFSQKLSIQSSRFEIKDRGRRFVIEDTHEMRLWTYMDLKLLIRSSTRFELTAIYDIHHNLIPLDSDITSESGNLYYVLKKIA